MAACEELLHSAGTYCFTVLVNICIEYNVKIRVQTQITGALRLFFHESNAARPLSERINLLDLGYHSFDSPNEEFK